MPDHLSSVLAEIIRTAPTLHRAGTFSSRVLETIARHASRDPVAHSAETGSGASTLLFSHLSGHHTVFALDAGTNSIEGVRRSPLLREGVVTFVEGPTQLTLPVHRFEHKLQLALIDGPHAYPFPDLEYYYLYPQLTTDALLIVDDVHIRSINNLFEFLSADNMFHLEEVVENTAFFRRTAAPTFSPVGDDWFEQGYNRHDFEVLSAVAGESDALSRVHSGTSSYIDELGAVKKPLGESSVRLSVSDPILVAGWAIDQVHQQPAA